MNPYIMLLSVLQGSLIGFFLALIVSRFLVTKNEQKIRQYIREQFAEQLQQGEVIAVSYRATNEFLPRSLFQDGEVGILYVMKDRAELYLRPMIGLVNPVATFKVGTTEVEWAGLQFPSPAYWLRLKQDGSDYYLTTESQLFKTRSSCEDLYRYLKQHFAV